MQRLDELAAPRQGMQGRILNIQDLHELGTALLSVNRYSSGEGAGN
jgi:hypothetical protein